jgi:hypothetical protein
MFGTNRLSRPSFPLLLALCSVAVAIGPLKFNARQKELQQPLGCMQDDGQRPLKPNPRTVPALLDALDVLQSDYFTTWQGIWPKSIDWTSAVIGTYLASALTTLSTSFSLASSDKANENLINKYFSQLTASYFGQDAFALRQEAYDDMLWVVLGWLESIKFTNTHSSVHYTSSSSKSKNEPWYGCQWNPAFAHRARIFWELASQGWDTSLCNGGMIWSPYLVPYKNAITNELYITASVSMYLYFPGDDNSSPFSFSTPSLQTEMEQDAPPHDPKYLAAAIEAYKWLTNSNMTDAKGLYVDGYHVSGWSRERNRTNNNTRCDARNEMVYTYNQGVLLSGQRGLYEATGAKSYLEDGHKLVSDVIAATGWDLKHNQAIHDNEGSKSMQLGKWHGLGRSGILEEACDAQGYCSQDSQTFKGIFFHHLTVFCGHLPSHLFLPGEVYGVTGTPGNIKEVRKWHDERCSLYGSWIKHNAKAALATLDREGRFGMWWGAPLNSNKDPNAEVDLPDEAVDYRNLGVPSQWKDKGKYIRKLENQNRGFESSDDGVWTRDLNDRGRGRTVETQGGGVSVLRAMWELVDSRG